MIKTKKRALTTRTKKFLKIFLSGHFLSGQFFCPDNFFVWTIFQSRHFFCPDKRAFTTKQNFAELTALGLSLQYASPNTPQFSVNFTTVHPFLLKKSLHCNAYFLLPLPILSVVGGMEETLELLCLGYSVTDSIESSLTQSSNIKENLYCFDQCKP